MRNLLLPQRQMKKMITQYRPREYGGKMAVFKATSRLFEIDESLGWKSLVSDLQIYDMTGDHISILNKSNARKVAKQLELLI